MSRRFEVQGRRVERRADGKIVRDHVRLAHSTERDTAFELADAMVAAKFTAWVFEVNSQEGKNSYALLKVLSVA